MADFRIIVTPLPGEEIAVQDAKPEYDSEYYRAAAEPLLKTRTIRKQTDSLEEVRKFLIQSGSEAGPFGSSYSNALPRPYEADFKTLQRKSLAEDLVPDAGNIRPSKRFHPRCYASSEWRLVIPNRKLKAGTPAVWELHYSQCGIDPLCKKIENEFCPLESDIIVSINPLDSQDKSALSLPIPRSIYNEVGCFTVQWMPTICGSYSVSAGIRASNGLVGNVTGSPADVTIAPGTLWPPLCRISEIIPPKDQIPAKRGAIVLYGGIRHVCPWGG